MLGAAGRLTCRQPPLASYPQAHSLPSNVAGSVAAINLDLRFHPSAAPACLQKQQEQADGSSIKVVEERTESFASWKAALSCSLGSTNAKRLNKLYLLLRGECRQEWRTWHLSLLAYHVHHDACGEDL